MSGYALKGEGKRKEQLDLIRFTEWLQKVHLFDLKATLAAAAAFSPDDNKGRKSRLEVVHRASV